MFLCRAATWTILALVASDPTPPAVRSLDTRLHHLRVGTEREWDTFPAEAEAPSLTLRFPARPNAGEATLRLRQQDVKQTWKVLLNGQDLARLRTDENDQVLYLPIPAGWLRDGDNTLTIEPAGRSPDDIRVGEFTLDDRPTEQVLAEATVEVQVHDITASDQPTLLPCRITVLNAQGALMTVGATSGGPLAVRPGVVYTGTGQARFGLPAGTYTVYAGRGFEYGIASARLTLRPGDQARPTLGIRREVPTEGYVSCDTHVHTLTFSGHGDATLDERVLTLAGEGIELPIATDHNRQIDYQAAAVKQGVRGFFTPVVGNEVTTSVGHFNIFPAPVDGPLPDHRLTGWKALFADIAARTQAPVVILNHPRDLHSGYRPFGPEHHNALTGENLDGWELQANGVEVVNSGAQQTDVLRPVHDWMGLLNRGRVVTPVGSSDSHDVSRYIVGQGRTYLRCDDARPAAIAVTGAVASFRAGRVLVSCGLLADITVNGRYGPGELAPGTGEVTVAARVLGPGWVTAEQVTLYANGSKVREATITDGGKAGVKWAGEWKLPAFRHDVHLVAVATGPGVRELYWPVGKPYQPTSPHVRTHVIGVTGAVWLDGDGDGKRTGARGYAEQLVRDAEGNGAKVVQALAAYDEAVAAQAAGLLHARGVDLQDEQVQAAVRRAGPQVERGVQAYREAWRETQLARGIKR